MLLVAALALLALPALANAGFGLGLESKGFELSLGEKRLAYAQGDPLFVILYSEAPDIWAARSWRMVGPDAEVVARGEHGYDFSVESFEGLAVQLRARAGVDAAKGEVTWDIQLENHAAGTVAGVIGPCLRNVQDRTGGFLVVPNRPGQRIDDPWNTLAKSIQHLSYPVPASMQYMAYSGRDGGVAVHVFDREMVYKQLAFGGEGRQMTFLQYPFVAPGGAWHSPMVLWQALSTDWHAAADRYRDWFRGWAHRPEISPAIKAMPSVPGVVILARPVEDAWLRDVQKSQEKGTYDAAQAQVDAFARGGMDGVHLVGWFGRGHDSTYPDHLPAEAMGGEAGLLRLAAKIRDDKMLAVYYLNARLLNVTNPTYQAHPDWAATTEDGNPRKEVIGGETFHVACPGCSGYREHIKNETLRVAERYHGDGVQLDQIGAAPSVLCFDKSHGHATPATGWAAGHVQMLKELYAALGPVNPKFFCWIEGAWEGAGQYVDLSQGGFWPDHPGAKSFPQMYRYTLPEHPLFGDATLGGVPYWCPTDIGRGKRMNAQAADFFWNGAFHDDIGLSLNGPGEAHWFSRDKAILITVHNTSQEAQTYEVQLKTVVPALTAARLLAEGTEIPVSIEGDQVTLKMPVPAGQVEAVLLGGQR